MTAEEDEENVIEREVAKGEQDDVLERRPQLERKIKKSKPRPKVLASKIAKVIHYLNKFLFFYNLHVNIL